MADSGPLIEEDQSLLSLLMFVFKTHFTKSQYYDTLQKRESQGNNRDTGQDEKIKYIYINFKYYTLQIQKSI